jgi:hypothetical protein
MRSRIPNPVYGSKDPDPSKKCRGLETLIIIILFFAFNMPTNNGFHASAARWRSISAMLRAVTSGPAAMSATNRSGIHRCSMLMGLLDPDP